MSKTTFRRSGAQTLLYNQTDGADWRDDGGNLYSGTVLDSASIQPGSDFLYKSCHLSGSICAGNESLHGELPDLYVAWHGGRSGIFRIYGRSR